MNVKHIFSKDSISALSEDQYDDMVMNSSTYTKNNQVGQEYVDVCMVYEFL